MNQFWLHSLRPSSKKKDSKIVQRNRTPWVPVKVCHRDMHLNWCECSTLWSTIFHIYTTFYYCWPTSKAKIHHHTFFRNLGLISPLPLFSPGHFKSEVLPSGFCGARPQGSERPAQSSTWSLEQQPDVTVWDAAGEGKENLEWRSHGDGPLSAHPAAIQELQREEWCPLCGCYQRGQVRMT